jgi:hypothetical protein
LSLDDIVMCEKENREEPQGTPPSLLSKIMETPAQIFNFVWSKFAYNRPQKGAASTKRRLNYKVRKAGESASENDCDLTKTQPSSCQHTNAASPSTRSIFSFGSFLNGGNQTQRSTRKNKRLNINRGEDVDSEEILLDTLTLQDQNNGENVEFDLIDERDLPFLSQSTCLGQQL